MYGDEQRNANRDNQDARLLREISSWPVQPQSGVKYPDPPSSSEYGTSYYRWWVGPASWDDKEAIEAFCAAHDADSWGRYGGPGRPFTNDATVRRSRTRVLVVQHGGLDI